MDSKSGYPHPEQQQHQQQFPDQQQQNIYPNVPPVNPPSYEQTMPQHATVMQGECLKVSWRCTTDVKTIINYLLYSCCYNNNYSLGSSTINLTMSVMPKANGNEHQT